MVASNTLLPAMVSAEKNRPQIRLMVARRFPTTKFAFISAIGICRYNRGITRSGKEVGSRRYITHQQKNVSLCSYSQLPVLTILTNHSVHRTEIRLSRIISSFATVTCTHFTRKSLLVVSTNRIYFYMIQ